MGITMKDQREAQYCLDAFAVVEATHFEMFQLWREWRVRCSWKDVLGPSLGRVVGEFGGTQIAIAIRLALIDGKLIGFYESTGGVTHFAMIQAWIIDAFPNTQVRTNAWNFHHVIRAIDDNERRSPLLYELPSRSCA